MTKVQVHSGILNTMWSPKVKVRSIMLMSWCGIMQETGSDKITPFVFSATGTGGWESALQNTLNPGDHLQYQLSTKSD